MSRIKSLFSQIKHPALITFITAGDPDKNRSVSIFDTLPNAGADLIELGVPFTDPMADGSVIQAANTRALNADSSLSNTLEMVTGFRKKNTHTPIVLMGYTNPVFTYGYERFISDSIDAGVDGIIMVDLPPEESSEFQRLAAAKGLDFIRLITPTTDETRLKTILQGATGFLYYVSITGVTGAAKPDPSKIKAHIDQIRKHTDLPIAVGFGIKTPEDAASIGKIADGVVVGSSIVQTVADHQNSPDLITKIEDQVKNLSTALKTLSA